MADLNGPKLHIVKLKDEPEELKPCEPFTRTTKEVIEGVNKAFVTFSRLPKAVR